MKILTPEISWHARDPIYSVDIQYSGGGNTCRLATCGTDRTIRLWKVSENKGKKGELEYLSCLNRHTRTINVIRFSPDGVFLASGGDDAAILLWKQNTSPPPVNNLFQEEEQENKETWTVTKTLRSHLEDVYDLCWSRDCKYLISGSVDNTAILWDIKKGQKIWIFTEHKSFVQGVAFDPAGQFLVTLCSDRSMRVYNFNSRCCVYNVKKINLHNKMEGEKPKPSHLFHDDTLKSFFRRLAFSPDGELLVVPSGFLDKDGDRPATHTSYVFTRKCLNKPAVYLPSPSSATLVVRFCPVKFELRKIPIKTPQNSSDGPTEINQNVKESDPVKELKEWQKYKTLFCLPYRLVYAIATEESILLYDTQQAEAIAFIGNIHYHQLSDLSWSSSGLTLVIASTDGYCTLISFAEGELGKPYIDPSKVKSGSEEEVKNLTTGIQETVKVTSQKKPKTKESSTSKATPMEVQEVQATQTDKPSAAKTAPAERAPAETASAKTAPAETAPAKTASAKTTSAGQTKGPRRIQITTLSTLCDNDSSSSSAPSTDSSAPSTDSSAPSTTDSAAPSTSGSAPSSACSTPSTSSGAPTTAPSSNAKGPRRVKLTTLSTVEQDVEEPSSQGPSCSNSQSSTADKKPRRVPMTTLQTFNEEEVKTSSANDSTMNTTVSDEDTSLHLVLESSLDGSSTNLEVPQDGATPGKTRAEPATPVTPSTSKLSALEGSSKTTPSRSTSKSTASTPVRSDNAKSPRRIPTVLLASPKTPGSSSDNNK